MKKHVIKCLNETSFSETNYVFDLLAREGVLMTDKLQVLEERRKNKLKCYPK